MVKSALRWATLFLGLLCVPRLTAGQAPLTRAREVKGFFLASLNTNHNVANADNGATSSPGQGSQGDDQSSSEPSVWDHGFDSQFRKLVTAAADNFTSEVKEGTDGPEVDLDLSVLGNTDTCGYLQGGTIGAPVCIFQFDAGQDETPARRNFGVLMSHIKTLLPGWKQEGPVSKDETTSAQFTADNESVKCSMEWSNSSGSYTFYINFVGHSEADAKRRRTTKQNHAHERSTSHP